MIYHNQWIRLGEKIWTIGGRLVAQVISIGDWILKTGSWDDTGEWVDTENWKDNE